MGLFDRRDTLDALEDLLDRERGDILVGNFSGLKRILVEKERLIKAAINGGTLEKLAPLQQKSERNQAMLMAAAQGIRSVHKKLSVHLAGDTPLQTYNQSGRVSILGDTPHNLERRA